MRPEHMKEIAESIGEGFFHDRVYEALTGKKELFPERKTEYLSRAIEFMDNAINGYRLMCEDKGVPLNKFFIEDGRSVLQIYTRVLRALPKDVRNKKVKDKKAILNILEDFQKTLTNIRSGKKVNEKKKRLLIELVNNMRKETLSETSRLSQNSGKRYIA